jgi:hypothetical protein
MSNREDVEVAVIRLTHAALIDLTWVLALAIVLRYCRTAIWVTRQYHYVHMLEDIISPLLGGDNIYRREGCPPTFCRSDVDRSRSRD